MTRDILSAILAATVLVLLSACERPGKQTDSAAISATVKNIAVVETAGDVAESPDVEMVLQKVSSHVYYVKGKSGVATDNAGFISNAGIILGADGIVLFDALGTPALARLLLGKIRELSDLPIKAVIASHYHADHIYGLQVFKEAGATILGPNGAELYLESEVAEQRLEERRVSLYPWVDDNTQLLAPDEYINALHELDMGGVRLTITPLGAAHSDGDLAVFVEPDNVLFSGDIIFEGRIPFVGDADTRAWLNALGRMSERKVTALIPGHGGKAEKPDEAVALTQRYLAFLRSEMGAAVDEFVSFDEAYGDIDWSEFADLPAFEEANRRNAYQVYLSLEAEGLAQQ